MSLIDEALKRAREQAERENAAQRSAASRWVPAYPLQRRRSRGLMWAGLAAACLLLGVGAGLLASRFSGGGEELAGGIELPGGTVEEGGEGGLPTAAGAVLMEDTTGTTDLSTDLPFPLPVTGLPEDEGLEPRLLPEPVPEPVPPPAPPGLEPVPPPQAQPVEPPAPSGAAADGAETHVRRAPLPGGGWIQLGGIAFSADQPVALLNGRVVSVGEVVEGFTVISIAPRRVELRGHGTTLVLTLD
ncbi:MAG TPA: hypothetical protein VNJ70_12240 [Thermoanaerobaculia bacterium]|nr:hypothetical protein [Thermoanaerobaculia bacterium]